MSGANRHSGSSNRGAPAGDSGIVWLAPSPSPADPPPSVARPGARPQVYAPGPPPVRHPAVRQPSTPPHAHIDTHTPLTPPPPPPPPPPCAHKHTMSAGCSFFSRRSLSAGPSKPVCWDAQRTDSLLRPDIATHLRGYAAAAGAAGAGRGRRPGRADGSQRARHSGRNARPRAGSGREIPSEAPGRPSDGSPPSEEAPQPHPGRQTGAYSGARRYDLTR